MVLCSMQALYAQAGKDTYLFLNLPASARTAAFGGFVTSVCDGDLTLAFNNPAILSDKTHNMLMLNYSNYLADINFGSVAYGRTLFGSRHSFGFGLHFIDYGKFVRTSVEDVQLGTFTAKDIALSLMYTYHIAPQLSAGITMKPIYSAYERYSSFGLAFDFGAMYCNDSIGFSTGLVVRNIGWQFTGYRSLDGRQHRESLPIDVQVGISQHLKYAPFRFTLTLHNLQRWNLGYERTSTLIDAYTQTNQGNGNSRYTGKVMWYDMLFRHSIWTMEVLLPKNIYLMASYNHRRRAEMHVPDFKSLAGFSFGAGLKIYKFRVDFALTSYQKGATAFQFTLGTGLSEFGVR